MKIRFWVQRFNVKDKQGEMLKRATTITPPTVTVCKNFIENRWDHRLGNAKLFISDYGIEAEFNWPSDAFPPVPLYPAIGGEVSKRDGAQVHCTITMLGLSTTPNADPWIRPLQEQCPEMEVAKG